MQYLWGMWLLKNWFERLQNAIKPPQPEVPEPAFRFGRYSDNNKTALQTRSWYEAERLFREKKYTQAFEAMLVYMRDQAENNILIAVDETNYTFSIPQGTKRLHGNFTPNGLKVEVALVAMPEPNKPVMRRLLDANTELYYSRYALREGVLCLLMDLPLDMCSPGKIYYGLKEMATRADQQDDLLLDEFATLQAADNIVQTPFIDIERNVKYHYLNYWIDNALAKVESLPADSFSGGIGYTLMALLYRIDFLITPEGKLMHTLDDTISQYWMKREELSAVERNQVLKTVLTEIRAWPKESILQGFYRNKAAFAISAAVPYTRVVEHIQEARQMAMWFLQNDFTEVAMRTQEYGLLFPLYTFSMPKPYTDLVLLFMQVNYPTFFNELGYPNTFTKGEQVEEKAVRNALIPLLEEARKRYPKLSVDVDQLPFDNRVHFNNAYLLALEALNFENPAP
jgi:hypothetical protein